MVKNTEFGRLTADEVMKILLEIQKKKKRRARDMDRVRILARKHVEK